MKKLLQEFRDFAMKGNVIDLAVAVVIGGAFGKIVSSLVADIITPFISLLSAGGSLAEWTITLRKASETAEAVTLNTGLFLQNIVDFLIIAGSIFLVIKLANKFKEPFRKKEEAEVQEEKPAPLTKDQELLLEIRDLLKK
ncbi:MAG: large-conductance mechanosensitive channel protein MscL [Candidatus Parcubacteria bacterium]|jgi:large conductance mechanosensitive channel|nr:MAG: large-conductance mechanosensitive channel protein MscL [Candidatus Parcubacteria bacterium]